LKKSFGSENGVDEGEVWGEKNTLFRKGSTVPHPKGPEGKKTFKTEGLHTGVVFQNYPPRKREIAEREKGFEGQPDHGTKKWHREKGAGVSRE